MPDIAAALPVVCWVATWTLVNTLAICTSLKPASRARIFWMMTGTSRSRKSRLAPTRASRIGRLRDAIGDRRVGADLVDEDLVQRRHDQLEPPHRRVRRHQRREQLLRHHAVGELDLAAALLGDDRAV